MRRITVSYRGTTPEGRHSQKARLKTDFRPADGAVVYGELRGL
jgi:hypothetical protein